LMGFSNCYVSYRHDGYSRTLNAETLTGIQVAPGPT
jgi:hypothetical protein